MNSLLKSPVRRTTGPVLTRAVTEVANLLRQQNYRQTENDYGQEAFILRQMLKDPWSTLSCVSFYHHGSYYKAVGGKVHFVVMLRTNLTNDENCQVVSVVAPLQKVRNAELVNEDFQAIEIDRFLVLLRGRSIDEFFARREGREPLGEARSSMTFSPVSLLKRLRGVRDELALF